MLKHTKYFVIFGSSGSKYDFGRSSILKGGFEKTISCF
jgi:hypothetical protein